jgi:hypothetical protein
MMSIPRMVAVAIPIAVPVTRMLRGDVIPPVRRQTVSAPDLACGSSSVAWVSNPTIFSIRDSGNTIAAIDISARDLSPTNRSTRIRMDGLRAELHRSRRTHPNR